MGPTPDLRSGKLPLSRMTMCASRFEGRCRFSPDLVDSDSLRPALRVILPCLFAACLLLGWCWGDGQLCMGVRNTARDPARPRNSPQLWAWHKETLKKCLLSETELPTGRLSHVFRRLAREFRGLTAALQGPGERSLCWRSLPEARTGLPGAGPCPRLLLPGNVWRVGETCPLCAVGTTAREGPRSFPSPAWRSCSGSTFLSVIVFLLQRGQRNVLGPANRRHIFAHLRPAGLRLYSLLFWCRISKLLIDRLARAWL